MIPTTTVLPAVVAETPVIDFAMFRNSRCASREDNRFALLRRIGLDDANPAKRLGQAAGDFSVDLSAFAKQRPERPERVGHSATKRAEHQQRDGGQPPVEPRSTPIPRSAVTKPPTS